MNCIFKNLENFDFRYKIQQILSAVGQLPLFASYIRVAGVTPDFIPSFQMLRPNAWHWACTKLQTPFD